MTTQPASKTTAAKPSMAADKAVADGVNWVVLRSPDGLRALLRAQAHRRALLRELAVWIALLRAGAMVMELIIDQRCSAPLALT